MTAKRKAGLGRCDAQKAGMLKALMLRGTPQDVAAWLVGVNGGRANDVLHGRLYQEEPPANDNDLRHFLEGSVDRFREAATSI